MIANLFVNNRLFQTQNISDIGIGRIPDTIKLAIQTDIELTEPNSSELTKVDLHYMEFIVWNVDEERGIARYRLRRIV